MTEKNPRVLTGRHFMIGNHAVAEGAMSAGIGVYAGYPITPSSPIAERLSWRIGHHGNWVQMEDEIASMAAIIGASVGGKKSMTATSGPGLSLMLENIGLAYMMEAPTVIVNIQRGGPSTGMPTLTSQGDIMQARWGSHGDINMIAYAPSTVQEMYDYTIKCFNAAEKYRTPVILLADQITALMTSNVQIPEAKDIELVERERPPKGLDNYLTYDPDPVVAPMAIAGDGYRVHMTGLTHDEKGYPATTPPAQAVLMKRMKRKFEKAEEDLVEYTEVEMEDAEICVLCYGTEARSVIEAVRKARSEGVKVGMLRVITVWPFPRKKVIELSKQVDTIIVPEGNMGQYVHPVTEYARDCEVISLPHFGGKIHTPTEVYNKIMEVKK